jgi:hypothetical protein
MELTRFVGDLAGGAKTNAPMKSTKTKDHSGPERNETFSGRQSIIGGMFGFELAADGVQSDPMATRTRPYILTRQHLRLCTARSAFALLAQTLRPAAVWLPSYLCGVVLHAFAGSTTRVNFYGVGEDLSISDEAWVSNVASGDMVVFIDYFGFNLWNSYGEQVRARGAWVIEDACQAMLNPSFSDFAHYVIASPRKFVGVPDGGILLAQGGASLPAEELDAPPPEWWLDALKSSFMRAEFDRHGGDRQWFDLFRRTDPNGPVEPRRMSELSSLLLDYGIDCESIAERRRRNFSQLAAALPEFAVFRTLSVDVVPLGFPVRLRERDRVRRALFESEIYPPVHWTIRTTVPEEFRVSHRLADEIMTLPCDQRCSTEDVGRVVQTFQSLRPTCP